MEEFNGTSGPWVWDDEGLGNTCRLVFGKDYPLEMTSKADRELITSAPELLEALQRFYRWYDDIYGDEFDYTDEHPIALAKAAIAKALGK